MLVFNLLLQHNIVFNAECIIDISLLQRLPIFCKASIDVSTPCDTRDFFLGDANLIKDEIVLITFCKHYDTSNNMLLHFNKLINACVTFYLDAFGMMNVVCWFCNSKFKPKHAVAKIFYEINIYDLRLKH